MYGLTFIDEFGKTQLLFFEGRAVAFNTKELAKRYETEFFIPYAKTLLEKGIETGSFLWFKKYKPIGMEEARTLTRILQTLLVRKIDNIKYGKTR